MDRKLEKPISSIRRELRRVEHLECPVYNPPVVGWGSFSETGLRTNIYKREDIDYPKQLVQAPSTDAEELAYSPDGWCNIPKVKLYVRMTFDIQLTR